MHDTDVRLEMTKKIIHQMILAIAMEERGGYQLGLIGEASLKIHKLYTNDE